MKLALPIIAIALSLLSLARAKNRKKAPAQHTTTTVKPSTYIPSSEALKLFNSISIEKGITPYRSASALARFLRYIIKIQPINLNKKELYWRKQDILAAAELKADFCSAPPAGSIPTKQAFALFKKHAIPGAMQINCVEDFYGKALPHVSPVCKYKKTCYWQPAQIIAFATKKLK